MKISTYSIIIASALAIINMFLGVPDYVPLMFYAVTLICLCIEKGFKDFKEQGKQPVKIGGDS